MKIWCIKDMFMLKASQFNYAILYYDVCTRNFRVYLKLMRMYIEFIWFIPILLIYFYVLHCQEHSATPLYFACQNGHLSVAEQLIAANAVVNTQRRVGCLPYYIMQNFFLDFITMLDCEKHGH